MTRPDPGPVPVVYEHAAALIGCTPWEVSRSGELLFRAHAEAFRVYRHRPVTAGIDIYNLEAEAYGATVGDPGGEALPTIVAHPAASWREIGEMKTPDPAADGRLPMVIEAAARLAGAIPEADVRVPVSGPFSLAAGLLGFDRLLCDLMDRPAAVARALGRLAAGQGRFCRAIAARGAGIVIFESAAAPPLVSPALFREIILPPLREMCALAASLTGRPSSCVVGGDTLPILWSILETGAGFLICPRETDQSRFMEEMKRRPEMSVRLNMDPAVFTPAGAGRLAAELERAAALAATRENTFLSTGALPFEADPALVRRARQMAARRP